MGQKPDDFRTVSLCKECHALQHSEGERTFWAKRCHMDRVTELIEAFCKASPKRAEIARVKADRANGK